MLWVRLVVWARPEERCEVLLPGSRSSVRPREGQRSACAIMIARRQTPRLLLRSQSSFPPHDRTQTTSRKKAALWPTPYERHAPIDSSLALADVAPSPRRLHGENHRRDDRHARPGREQTADTIKGEPAEQEQKSPRRLVFTLSLVCFIRMEALIERITFNSKQCGGRLCMRGMRKRDQRRSRFARCQIEPGSNRPRNARSPS